LKQAKIDLENLAFDKDDELVQTINDIIKQQPEVFSKTKKSK